MFPWWPHVSPCFNYFKVRANQISAPIVWSPVGLYWHSKFIIIQRLGPQKSTDYSHGGQKIPVERAAALGHI